MILALILYGAAVISEKSKSFLSIVYGTFDMLYSNIELRT